MNFNVTMENNELQNLMEERVVNVEVSRLERKIHVPVLLPSVKHRISFELSKPEIDQHTEVTELKH